MCLRSVAVTMTSCLLSRGLGWVINFLFSHSFVFKVHLRKFYFCLCIVNKTTAFRVSRLYGNLLRPSYIQCCNTHDFESALNKCHGVDA